MIFHAPWNESFRIEKIGCFEKQPIFAFNNDGRSFAVVFDRFIHAHMHIFLGDCLEFAVHLGE